MHRASISFVLLASLLVPQVAQAADADEVYGKALKFLLNSQHENGSFGQIPGQPPGEIGITGLVIRGLAQAPGEHRAMGRRAAEKAMAWVLGHQQPDGSFTQQRSGLSTYRTAIAINAMAALDKAKYRAQIDKAAAWLKQDQFDAGEKIGEDNPHYGGFGYGKAGKKPDADMSNTLMALGALRDAGVKSDDPVFKRALLFLKRCQNSSETNPGVGKLKPKNDGGFIYDPGLSRNKSAQLENADGTVSFESYASMTYGGLMSLLHAGVNKDDPTIKAALAWIGEHYTLEENYGLGVRQKDPKAAQQGMFYYFHVFAKSLATLDTPTIQTKQGPRNWAQDLVDVLAKRQSKDGSFTNPVDRWWEKDPVLVTAYVINALDYAYPYLEAKK